jgi:hypothetical protein
VPRLATLGAGELLFDAAAPAAPRVRTGEDAAGPARWEALAADVPDALLDALEATVSPTDLATVFFTSGTTAQAKAVVHAHGALALSGRRVGECMGVGPDDAWWGHMPLFWSGGFVIGALATMAGGGRLVLQEVVEPGAALSCSRPSGTLMAAGTGGALLDHPGSRPDAGAARAPSTCSPTAMGPTTAVGMRHDETAPASPAPAPTIRRRYAARPSAGRWPAWTCASSIRRAAPWRQQASQARSG